MALEQVANMLIAPDEVHKRMTQLGRAVKRATTRPKAKRAPRVRRDAVITLEKLKAEKGLSMAAFAKRFVP